jgi:uncharacterized membrane protein YdcZ (DUF606 family)
MRGMTREKRWMFGIGIVAVFILTLVFIVRQAMHAAGLSMALLFVLTNSARAAGFRERGMMREARWMNMLAGFFGILFIVLAVMLFI